MPERSLNEWLELVEQNKKYWGDFYQVALNAKISNYPRFYKSLNLYGVFPMVEAVLAAANAELSGDPLNYVIKVAAAKWREEAESKTDTAKIEKIIKNTTKKNEELAKKLKR